MLTGLLSRFLCLHAGIMRCSSRCVRHSVASGGEDLEQQIGKANDTDGSLMRVRRDDAVARRILEEANKPSKELVNSLLLSIHIAHNELTRLPAKRFRHEVNAHL